MPEEYLTANQVLARLQISRTTLARLMQRPDFPRPIRLKDSVKAQLRFPVAQIAAWERDRLVKAVEAA